MRAGAEEGRSAVPRVVQEGELGQGPSAPPWSGRANGKEWAVVLGWACGCHSPPGICREAELMALLPATSAAAVFKSVG